MNVHSILTSEKHFPKTISNEILVIAFLQIYRELLFVLSLIWVHSNSHKVSYLSWQNKYPNLKTTSHIQLNLLFWTKLLENLHLEKYLISAAATLITNMSMLPCIINFKLSPDMELILRFPLTNLWLFLSFRFCKTNLGIEEFLS